MSLVSIKNLSFSFFDKKILRDINFEIKENENVVLIGANGAGKSTLLRVISGLHMPQKYDKFNVLGTSSPQDQFKGLAYLGNRWEKNVNFYGVSPYSADIRAGDMMKVWQNEFTERRNELANVLEVNLDWKMHQVSDGQRKRVQIMLSLLRPFKLLIIDEFLNELDVVVRDKFFDYINKECKLRNGSVIYATHIFDNIEEWGTKVIYISNGTCENKLNIDEFNKNGNFFKSVKNKIISDKKRKLELNEQINPLIYGPQHGYSSGRLNKLI